MSRLMVLNDSSQQQGRHSEDAVCRYLRRRGWRIVARNWHGAHSELDIVASRWRTLLVVEVRYRREDPLSSIDEQKLRFLRRGIGALIRQHQLQQYRLRLDLVGIDHSGTWHWSKDVWRGRRPGDGYTGSDG